MLSVFQKGFNYSQDGPGNRLVYHLQGCNFKCKWCSNPEGMEIRGQKAKCFSVEELVSECVRSKMMFFDGGGVTLTGGEPTLQFEEIFQLLNQLKEQGIHTAMETNGSSKKLSDLLPLTDFLIMDFKHYDSTIHQQWTGCDNETTQNNILKILHSRRQLLIRIPLINQFNTDPAGFIKFFKYQLHDNVVFELLPYHEYGKGKWDRPYEIDEGFVPEEVIGYFKNELVKNGFRLIET